ncbi:unnamed protein product [Sphagnum balticum]
MGPTGRIAAKPLGRLARYFGETAEAADKAGFRMLPSEAHAAKAGVFETYPKGSIFTSGKMANWRELQNKETEAAARRSNSLSQHSWRIGGKEAGLNAAGSTLGTLAGQAALWRTVAAAITNPEMSEKLLIAMRRAARFAPYGADIGYNLSKKAQEFVNKSKDDLIKKSEPLDGAGRPQSSLAKPLSPQELRERANQMNPAATGQVAYDYHAVHPQTGHHVISRDGRVWLDSQTGQQVG